MLIHSGRRAETDKKFDADESNSKYANVHFVRLIAKRRSFKNVDFRYTIFENCYLRDCIFDSCNFIGCKFVGSNFHGSRFSGCKFDYATFEKTFIDTGLLDTECPALENLKARFARTLRTNYQQLGDANAANRAMEIELQATEIHLHKAWDSNESYYRQKYRGWKRIKSFFAWIEFKSLDFIWGNGESAWRLLRSVLFILALMTIFDVLKFGDPQQFDSYLHAISIVPSIFLGVLAPNNYEKWYLAAITFARLIAIGFFLSIVIKRFNRR